MLKVPDELSGVGIERYRRIRVEGVVGDAGLTARIAQRCGVVGLRRTEKREIELRIVATGNPYRSAVALVERQAVPTVAAWLAGPRDDVEPPRFLSGRGIKGDDHVTAGRSANGSDHNLAPGDQRPTGQAEAVFAIANCLIPDNLSVFDIESHDMHIRRRYVEAIAIDRDGTLHRRLLVAWQLPRILPQ